MASLCRWVGGGLLVIGTVGIMARDYAGATACGVLALVWIVAALVIEASSRSRTQPPRDP